MYFRIFAPSTFTSKLNCSLLTPSGQIKACGQLRAMLVMMGLTQLWTDLSRTATIWLIQSMNIQHGISFTWCTHEEEVKEEEKNLLCMIRFSEKYNQQTRSVYDRSVRFCPRFQAFIECPLIGDFTLSKFVSDI